MRDTDPSVFDVLGPPALVYPPSEILRVLGPMLTDARRERIEGIAAQRSRQVTPVLENLRDPHNASAVLRSCDAFGVQDIHVVSDRESFKASHDVAKGTQKWLDVQRHDSPEACVEALHRADYEVYVAAMDGEHTPESLGARAADHRIAVVFGNEHRGASQAMRSGADGTYRIPMIGFVESLNVSVAAAITLYQLTRQVPRRLSGDEREALIARFMMASLGTADAVLREALGDPAPPE